jgi:peptide/nickel transport system substrate-binding protein
VVIQKLTKNHFYVVLFLLLYSARFVPLVFAWSNGGYSADPSNPDYGTHDWLAEHALAWLPSNEKEYLENNLVTFLYGTELPDNGQASDGIGDTAKHHIYYFNNGTVHDGSAAVRAYAEFNVTLSFLNANDFVNASKHAGIMAHYITDMAVFGHVMGIATDWGAEQHHSDYENHVNTRTNSFNDDFNTYLSYDGSLDLINAYDAAIDLAYDTTFDFNGELTCVWMDTNYDWSNSTFTNRCGESLNQAANALTDVLHTLYSESEHFKLQSYITCFSSTPSITITDELIISGALNPTLVGETITLTYTKPDMATFNQTSLTDTSGGFSDSISPGISGSWSVMASWEGDATYGRTSSSSTSFTVTKILTTLSCSASSADITENNAITILGTLDPALGGQTIALRYEKPDSSMITRTATTGTDGSYSDSYTPTDVGSWKVTASWNGDVSHKAGSSTAQTFEVKKKNSCIIATTTFGSELSPEVHFLRNFRDHTVLSTFAGSSFMTVFNEFYYSFSPNIASVIADNEPVRSLMKVVLYPLIGILHLSSRAFSLFSFIPEFGVVTAGFIASALIGLVYFAPWILLISLTKKFAPSRKVLRWMSLLWLGSIFTMTVAGITKLSLLMIASTGIFVIATISLTVLTVTHQVSKRYILRNQ